jgi:hypothetical protein
MDGLSRYERATVGLWARAHAELTAPAGRGWLALAAAHAVLARLRRLPEPAGLLAAYAADPAPDLALAASVVPGPPDEGRLRLIRDAAFHLRWREIAGEEACSTSGG